jgi:hypothetical protein
MAFATPGVQITVAELEDKLFASRLAPIEISRPVFVTALPRSGTTMLLETLASLDEFTSHTYRRMPFVLCPLLWSKMSEGLRRDTVTQERAHQDGVFINLDSPEAFEEMIWMAFWKDQYGADRIKPWTRGDAEFFDFMRSHMKKIISLAAPAADSPRRYLSKNNLNIARIGILAESFKDAAFLVPFRHPLQHAASLLRQHLNFLEVHRRDRFAREYMKGIGHFDFGENIRPVDFDGWLSRASHNDPTTLHFWIEYWIATYEYVAKFNSASLMCFEDLCSNPSTVLKAIGELLDVDDCTGLLSQTPRFHMPATHDIDAAFSAEPLVRRAQELYDELRQSSFHSPS